MTFPSEARGIESEYIKKTYDMCLNMKIGEVKILDRTHKSYEKFVTCLKLLIDWQADIVNGFHLDFNGDYSKLRKLSWI